MTSKSPHWMVVSLVLLATLALSPTAAAALPRPTTPDRLIAFEAGLRVAASNLGDLLARLWATDTAPPPQQDENPDDSGSGTDTGMSIDPNG